MDAILLAHSALEARRQPVVFSLADKLPCTRLLQEHGCMDYPAEKPVTSFTAPFDRAQHSQLHAALQSGSEVLIANALASATSGILSSSKLPTISLRLQEVPGLLETLVSLSVSGPTLPIQHMSLQLLVCALSSFSVNREALLHVLTPAILASMDSVHGRLRTLAYEGTAAAGETYTGASLAVELDYCSHLVRRVREEVVAYVQTGAKTPLSACLHALDRLLASTHTGSAEQSFLAGAVPALVDVLLLQGVSASTLASALRCLAALTTLQHGKEALVQAEKADGALAHIMSLCTHADHSVVAAAAYVMTGALMEDAAKRAVMDAGKGLAPLLDATELMMARKGLHRPRPDIQLIQARIAACSALATVAGHPHARQLLNSPAYNARERLTGVARVAQMELGEETDLGGTREQLLIQLMKVAQRASEAITWVP